LGLFSCLALAGCGPSLKKSALVTSPETADTLAVASETAPDADVFGAGLEGVDRIRPEVLVLDDLYRETLQAIRDDDLDGAQSGINDLEKALRNFKPDDELSVAFHKNLQSRVARLRELVRESREFRSYVAQMDSLGTKENTEAAAKPAPKNAEPEPSPSDPRHDLKLVHNGLTDRWTNYFTGDGRHYMDLWLSRRPLYEDMIESILKEYDLPRDLLYLAMIESGLNLQARSYANAVGPWQFISSTGRLYGLKVDWWLDERRHLEKSTRAAASHLSDLYESLGSWPLAMAAYNCGIRRVERAIRKQKTRDFWELSSLPRQTRNYVPKFMAALYIGHDPERYGFVVQDAPPYKYDVVRVDQATDLHLIAESAGTTLDSILSLNPHLKRWSTPPGQTCEVLVPKGTGDQARDRLAQIPAEERVTWQRHQVRRGETLAVLAQRYGTSAEALKQANGLRRNSVRSGNYLLIPVPGGRGATLPEATLERAAAGNDDADSDRTVHVVRRGETLAKISRRYGVSVRQIMEWNNMGSTRIHSGQRLQLQGSIVEDEGDVAARTVTYVVQRGDTLHTISQRHRVSVRELMNWNGKRSTRIRVGERLRIHVSG
jgi:membrane-bound lytic murein transglycosylase D